RINDLANVGQRSQQSKAAVASIDAIDVDGSNVARQCRRDGERAKRSRLTGSRGSKEHQVAISVGIEVARPLLLIGRVVQHTDGNLVTRVLGESLQLIGVSQFVQPRSPRL